MRRWLRLDAQWDDTEWVMLLEPLAQLAWIKLLCYVKRDGRRGVVHALGPKAAAKKWGIPVQAVEDMIFQARQDGALAVGAVEGGAEKWTLTKWAEYQEPDSKAAERQRRHRAGLVVEGNVTPVTPLSRRDTVAHDHRPPTLDHQTAGDAPARKARRPRTKRPATDCPPDWKPNEGHRALAKAEGVDCDREAASFKSKHAAKGNQFASWDQAFTNWLLKANEFKRPAYGQPTETPGLDREAAEWREKKAATEARLREEADRLTKAATLRNGTPPTHSQEPSGNLGPNLARYLEPAAQPREPAA